MTQIIYLEHNGTQHIIDVEPGLSLMEGAVQNGVPGIDADCGGAGACATCHVYISDAFAAKLDAPLQAEEDMLEFAEEVTADSRLSCQIVVSADLEGLIVNIPARQR